MPNRTAHERRDSSQQLLRKLVAIALTSIVVILALATYGLYRVYFRHVIGEAEGDAVGIGQAVLALERETLLSPGPDGLPRLHIEPAAAPALDRRLRIFLHPFEIVKIKVFAPDGTIVYSTDPLIVGRVDKGNERLAHALAGFIDSKFERKEEVIDLVEEHKFDVDVVETYLPIREPGGAVVGSFEVYLDVTRHRQVLRTVVATSLLVLGAILLAVFALSFLAVRRATGRLRAAQAALETLAGTDPLTGLVNRRRVLVRSEEEMERLQRERERRPGAPPLTLLMLDIDHFKKCNDTHGHLAGDQVLREVATRVLGCTRHYDVVGRYGGEEFLLLLPGTGFPEARAIAERIRKGVAQQPVEFDGGPITVTVSIGIACAGERERTLAPLLQRADRALYLAKQGGRNRVAWVEGENVQG
jgi:diguanylate cyclase (GGDEF)-like protein